MGDETTATMRRCSQCLVEKPIDDFYARTSGRTRAGRRSECRVCSAEQRRVHGAKFAAAHPRRVMLKLARQRARAAGVPFALRETDFDIPRVCPVLGIELEHRRGKRGPADCSPTLDRIVPSLGYVPGNVIVISWRANRLKSDAVMSELTRIAEFFSARLSASESSAS
jgi:hypothetical protein